MLYTMFSLWSGRRCPTPHCHMAIAPHRTAMDIALHRTSIAIAQRTRTSMDIAPPPPYSDRRIFCVLLDIGLFLMYYFSTNNFVKFV